MGKSAPAPPPAPDYAAAATAQGQANLQAAAQGAVLSNPNINGPLGSQQVSYGSYTDPNTGQSYMQPTINQTLTPEAQAALQSQQQVQAGLGGLAQQALGTAGQQLGQRFTPQGVNLQTGLPNAGAIPGAPNLGMYGQAQGGVQGPNLQTNLNTSNVAGLPVDAGTTGQQAILERVQPQIAQQNAALQQQMANQGIGAGSEAYNNAMRVQGQSNNDMLQQAALQGIGLDFQANQQGMTNAMNTADFANQAQLQQFQSGLSNAGLYNQALSQNQGAALQQQQAGMASQNQAYNQALQSGQFGNQAMLQSYQQQLAQFNQPLNQISALMSGSQVQMPQFQGYTGQNVSAAPMMQATQDAGQFAQNIYGQQVAAYNAGMQGIGSAIGGIAGLGMAPVSGGGSLAGNFFSDVRLKSNIVRVGTHPLGIGIYDYDIFGIRARGVMAHEVETVRPSAVSDGPGGFKMVDYGALNV